VVLVTLLYVKYLVIRDYIFFLSTSPIINTRQIRAKTFSTIYKNYLLCCDFKCITMLSECTPCICLGSRLFVFQSHNLRTSLTKIIEKFGEKAGSFIQIWVKFPAFFMIFFRVTFSETQNTQLPPKPDTVCTFSMINKRSILLFISYYSWYKQYGSTSYLPTLLTRIVKSQFVTKIKSSMDHRVYC